ncbi:MAG TPA: radical SAM protein, partial [Casimicrobiaceae bacterium]
MESIYYVMAWACHRKCRHCYEERFRPYVRGELEAVVAEAERNFPRIVANFPSRITYRDLDDPQPDGTFPEKTGRVILSGGESLLDPVRERVTYRVIEALSLRYARQGGIKIVVQTTGDLLSDAIVDDLLARGVWMISVAGVDDFHVGLEGPDKQHAFVARLSDLFARHDMKASGLAATTRNWHEEEGPLYSFFGATPDSWIGKLWPRGRAWRNGLSRATLADNFCNRWSGGLNFLRHQFNGSEVSVEPN